MNTTSTKGNETKRPVVSCRTRVVSRRPSRPLDSVAAAQRQPERPDFDERPRLGLGCGGS